ncbi:MAG: tyrosine-type recombinase/integrase [Blastocatellia bacterium]
MSFKPKKPSERRIHTLACLLLDTGLRVEEAVTLELPKVALDNMRATVFGKGSKERIYFVLPINSSFVL